MLRRRIPAGREGGVPRLAPRTTLVRETARIHPRAGLPRGSPIVPGEAGSAPA